MKKIIILIGVLILLYGAWGYYKAFLYHSKISYDNVESVWIGKESKSKIILTKDQQKEIVEAFNSAKFVNDNDELAGPTYRCSGEI